MLNLSTYHIADYIILLNLQSNFAQLKHFIIMSNSKILKVRNYIHEKFHVFFSCVHGDLLYSQNALNENQIEDVISSFPGLECFTFSDGQTFCFNIFEEL